MTPSEIIFKLNNLPPNTPITAEHIILILGALTSAQTKNNEPSYSSWDSEKNITPEALAEWIGEPTERLAKWRLDGVGPKFIKNAKHIRYKVGEVRNWLSSRTVQSTTQAENLSFASIHNSQAFIMPTVFHDNEPYSLFDSIDLLESDPETNITGFELFSTESPIAKLYLQNNFAALHKLIDINQPQKYFINAQEYQGTLAHVVAKYPKQGILELLPTLNLDFSIEDSQGMTAFASADETIRNFLLKINLMKRLNETLPINSETKRKTKT